VEKDWVNPAKPVTPGERVSRAPELPAVSLMSVSSGSSVAEPPPLYTDLMGVEKWYRRSIDRDR
jgi:hypothetical protein